MPYLARIEQSLIELSLIPATASTGHTQGYLLTDVSVSLLL